MSDDITSPIKQMPSYTSKVHSHTLIKPDALSMQGPSTETNPTHQTESFKDILAHYVNKSEGHAPIQQLAGGQPSPLQDVNQAMEEAESSFKLMMEIHNKLIDAYKDINK